MINFKRAVSSGVMALSTILLVSGCVAPGSTTGVDSTFFQADFVVVNPQVLPSATPVAAGSSDSAKLAVLSISGRGTVQTAVIDPIPDPLPSATPVANEASSGSNMGPISPPVYNAPELVLDYPISLASDDCQAKAAQAAAQGLHLIVQGQGSVSYWAEGSGGGSTGGGSGSGGGSTGSGSGSGSSGTSAVSSAPNMPAPNPTPVPATSGALIEATQIFSCQLGPSICSASQMCVQPQITCPKGAMCVPQPCQCVLPPAPTPVPTATPVAAK